MDADGVEILHITDGYRRVVGVTDDLVFYFLVALDALLDEECGIEMLGTSAESIERAEDRELFKELCQQIGEPVVPSQITYSAEEALEAAEKIGYPVILRPAFTLGGPWG